MYSSVSAFLFVINFVQAEKIESMPQHPMKERISKPSKGRLKRSSFTREAKKLTKAWAHTLPPTRPMALEDLPQPWMDAPTNVHTSTEIPHVAQMEPHENLSKRTLTLAMIFFSKLPAITYGQKIMTFWKNPAIVLK